MYRKRYADVEKGPKQWQTLEAPTGPTYAWDSTSTYLQNPPYFEDTEIKAAPIADIHGARVLALLGDSVTTDHISPIGAISLNTPAADFCWSVKCLNRISIFMARGVVRTTS